ncbi:hypothetical protein TNCV_2118651 [Trichonephila clavipes]|nr:hypothetical protein TNCV_2118651 [Trichonephila clavipes]
MFSHETKHMEIAWRHALAVGRMVRPLPLELDQFRWWEPGDTQKCFIMEYIYTLCLQHQSFVFDGLAV